MGLLASIPTLLSFLILHNNNQVEYAWLAGSWTGDGFGGTSQEVWSQPDEQGVMMGMYRHYRANGELNFYEFILLDQNGMRLKHFDPDLKAWEEKEDYLHFEMVEIDEGRIEMKGLVLEQTGDDKMEIRLDMKRGEKKWTEVFHMQRQ